MRSDLTDLTVVIDRSGSMASCQSDAEGGLNTFIDNQKKQPGECVFTLVQFDSVYEFVHKGVPIRDVGKYKLVPRGGTALLDAVGRAINETGERLAAMPEANRPGLVVFVILTDGQENQSREFSLAKIKRMIETQQNVFKWQFSFLGVGADAFADAASMGISADATGSYMTAAIGGAFAASSGNVTRMRCATLEGKSVSNAYTEEERLNMTTPVKS